MKFFGRNSQLRIDGKTYVGNNISIIGNRVYVDGKLADGPDENIVDITVLCNVDKIVSDESIYIKGNVTGNVEARTSVSCNDIYGNVKAGTSVNCDDVEGDVTAGTSVNCDDIKGRAFAPRVNR